MVKCLNCVISKLYILHKEELYTFMVYKHSLIRFQSIINYDDNHSILTISVVVLWNSDTGYGFTLVFYMVLQATSKNTIVLPLYNLPGTSAIVHFP